MVNLSMPQLIIKVKRKAASTWDQLLFSLANSFNEVSLSKQEISKQHQIHAYFIPTLQ